MGHKSGVTQIVIPETSDSVKQSVVAETGVGEVKPEQANGKPNVYQRWNRVLSEIRSVEKLGRNVDQKYDYMKAADVLKELRPLFAKHGLVLKANPRADTIDDSEYQSKSGNSTAHFVRMIVDYVLINIDEPSDCVELVGVGDASDYSDKAVNKARTGSLKYTLRDNFMIDDQDDVAESDSDTPDRAGPQNKVGRQATAQPAVFQGRTQKFTGSVVECEERENEDGPFMWFTLHDRTDRIYSFRKEDFQWIKVNNRLIVTCTEKQGRQGKIYWEAVSLIAPLTPDYAASEPKPNARPVAVQESAAQILKRMFPEPKDVKRKRLVETLLEAQPESLHAKILQSFEKRINSEHPSSETGVMSLLDLSIRTVTEEAEELFRSEATQ